jgi:8-amino-7-oxononanoate synthase
MVVNAFEVRMKSQLEQRKLDRSYRTLDKPSKGCDFSSNDYLGLAHSVAQHEFVQTKYEDRILNETSLYLGSTGSRLLSGNSSLHLALERFLAQVHNRPGALICNSGYDANLSLLSSIPLPSDFVILDELVHNSLVMGVKMSRIPLSQVKYFHHNDVNHLKQTLTEVLAESKWSNILIVIESVYSMDGDIAPVEEIFDLAHEFGSSVIVDEAHGLGIFGPTNIHNLPPNIRTSTARSVSQIQRSIGGTGVINALRLEHHPALLATCYTFGKAAGAHGACIVGSTTLIDFLINYARPFIYSTSLPSHSLWTIKCSYDTMIGPEGDLLRTRLFKLVAVFREQISLHLIDDSILLPSVSPIQAILIRGNERCIAISNQINKHGLTVYPIRSPTVKKGEERIRIIIHAHNTESEIYKLVHCIAKCLNEENRNEFNAQMSSKL